MDCRNKYRSLDNQYATLEANLKRNAAEIKNLRTEIQKFEKCQGSNNLFTVEVYTAKLRICEKNTRKMWQNWKVMHNQNRLKTYKVLRCKDNIMNLSRNISKLKNDSSPIRRDFVNLRN